MQHVALAQRQDHFAVVAGTARSQAAVMVLQPGQDAGPYGNEHAGSDQWLLVLDGEGEATVGGRTIALGPQSLLLIAAGEPHAVRAGGTRPLRTVSIYAPPGYDADGEPLAEQG